EKTVKFYLSTPYSPPFNKTNHIFNNTNRKNTQRNEVIIASGQKYIDLFTVFADYRHHF
ncbi:MAG: hypothetical protein ACI93H_001500, partial [Psychromonas sp.]